MDIVTQFLAILCGVIVSIVLPIVVQWMKIPTVRASGWSVYVNSVITPYIKAGIAAIIVSFVILLFAPQELDNWKAAAMLGLGWQAFIKSLLA